MHPRSSRSSATRTVDEHSWRRVWPWLALLGCLLVLDPVLARAKAPKSYRQPAYIANAYFSDRMTQKGEGAMQPMSVVKSLRAGSEGVAGYFVLDLVLTASGTHHFKVDILDQEGTVATRLDYPPVKASREEQFPLYAAVGTLSGKLAPGLWFLKVYDQLDKHGWEHLGIFGIQVVEPTGD
ncbi:MAG: hypothetical protein HQL91_09900 [Magnetococcales bacterium]|nr:hypothetical protein [Magnetococcales bacterium]